MDTINLRVGVPEDEDAFVQFNREMARETESKELALETVRAGVRTALENPVHGFYVLAEDAGEIVGSLMVTYEWSDWRDGLFWWIQSVYVKPSHRRRGLYRRLYDFVRERARARGDVVGFRLYVDKDNRVAQQTYAALGMSKSNYLMYEEMIEA